MSHVECLPIYSSTNHLWCNTRCGLWIIFTRAIFATSFSLPTALRFPTPFLGSAYFPVPTTIFSIATVSRTVILSPWRISAARATVFRWSTASVIWSWFATHIIQLVSKPSVPFTFSPWRPPQPATKPPSSPRPSAKAIIWGAGRCPFPNATDAPTQLLFISRIARQLDG